MATVTMKELLEAGVHFGHQVRRWNPKMKEYIFGERNGIYIIDLQKTQKLFRDALNYVTETLTERPRMKVLFVGTKRQAQDAIKEEAERAGGVGEVGHQRIPVHEQPAHREHHQHGVGGEAHGEQHDGHEHVPVLAHADRDDPAGHDQGEVAGREVADDVRHAARGRRPGHVCRG